MLKSLETLFSRPWFYRLWTVQEIGLPKEGLVFWGAQSIPWYDIGMAASWIQLENWKWWHTEAGTWADLFSDIPASYAGTKFLIGNYIATKKFNFLDALAGCRHFISKDPRDKVYGVVSFAQPREAEALRLDYDKSVGEVYGDTVRCWIEVHSDLKVLSFVNHDKGFTRSDDFRSWVPRWDLLAATALYVSSWWSACADTNAQTTDVPLHSSDELCLVGISYDTVTEIEQPVVAHCGENLSDGHGLKECTHGTS